MKEGERRERGKSGGANCGGDGLRTIASLALLRGVFRGMPRDRSRTDNCRSRWSSSSSSSPRKDLGRRQPGENPSIVFHAEISPSSLAAESIARSQLARRRTVRSLSPPSVSFSPFIRLTPTVPFRPSVEWLSSPNSALRSARGSVFTTPGVVDGTPSCVHTPRSRCARNIFAGE